MVCDIWEPRRTALMGPGLPSEKPRGSCGARASHRSRAAVGEAPGVVHRLGPTWGAGPAKGSPPGQCSGGHVSRLLGQCGVGVDGKTRAAALHRLVRRNVNWKRSGLGERGGLVKFIACMVELRELTRILFGLISDENFVFGYGWA